MASSEQSQSDISVNLGWGAQTGGISKIMWKAENGLTKRDSNCLYSSYY